MAEGEQERGAPTADVDVLSFSSAELEMQCATLRGAVEAAGGDVAALDKFAPGGAENPELPATGARAWYRYFRQLDRAHGALSGSGSGRQGGADARLSAALTAALTEQPVAVQFADGELRMVHPKSYHALAWLDSLDRQVIENAKAAAAAAESLSSSAELQTYAIAPLAMSLSVRLWLWILTHKGSGLPFEEDANLANVTPPKWTTRAAPEDLLKVFEAHVEVHQTRLALIAQAFPPEGKSDSRLPLAGFIGALASESGVDARVLMRVHSLGKIFATSVAASQANREARARAEQKTSSSTGAT